jgi:hypothetical protein
MTKAVVICGQRPHNQARNSPREPISQCRSGYEAFAAQPVKPSAHVQTMWTVCGARFMSPINAPTITKTRIYRLFW